MKITRLFALCLLMLLAACTTPGTLATLPPTATPTPTPQAQKVVEVALVETSSISASAKIAAGSTAHLKLSLAPVLLTIAPGSVSTRPWEGASLKDMQVCFALDRPCSLDGQPWTPFQSETLADYPVDWLGSRPVYAVVQVRDPNGVSVPVYLSYGSAAAPQVQASLDLISQIDEAVAADKQPAFVQTAIAATRAAFPLTGSVVIAGGKCCAGGEVGATINIPVTFTASSPTATVTQMRVSQSGDCPKDAASLDAPWEPFATSREYPVKLVINWTTFSMAVQYRDDRGNLSPVYCADISVEGNPPMPTP